MRKGSENVVGPMPPYGDIIKTEDDIWKIMRARHYLMSVSAAYSATERRMKIYGLRPRLSR